jgi:hypothetical protein
MSDKLTLEKARELIESKDSEIQGLQAHLNEIQNSELFKGLAITRKEENAVVSFESATLIKLQADFKDLETQKATLEEAFTKADEQLKAANIRIAELEKQDTSVSSRAREFLAGMGGKPLSISPQGEPELTANDLRKQMNSETDPGVRASLYKKLKALEAKENGSKR